MPNFCLVPSVAEQFKKDILSGDVDPAKLTAMTSAERHAFFASKLGEANATPVNALFESKLLLKNQQQGMVNWARRVLKHDPVGQKDLISKIQRLDKVLSPAEEESFLEELAAQRLGVGVSYEEAQQITELYKAVDAAKGTADRLDYGRAVVKLNNYVNGLKLKAEQLSLADFKKNPGKATIGVVSEIAGNAKAIKASMDNSAIFRQGWKVLWTHPDVWAKNAVKSFADLIRTFGKDEVMNELNADIVSRPTYDLMRKAKLAVGNLEEAFPTTLPEKIPFIGRIYSASQNAYTAFVQKSRADVFDKYIEIAKDTGVELTTDELQSVGKLVNSLTGRGNLGKLEPVADVVNNVFFSPRMIKAHIDTFTQPFTGAGGSNFVRKQAAINLLKITSGIATILGIAKVLGAQVEFDSRSADFGKIRIKDTRFDVSGGMSSLITLASRLLRKSTKSSTTGKITELNAKDSKGNPKFGAQTKSDVIFNYFTNKLSPAASVLKDLADGEDFDGNTPTFTSSLKNLTVPLPITNYQELRDNPNSANKLVTMLADFLGISTNTYSAKK